MEFLIPISLIVIGLLAYISLTLDNIERAIKKIARYREDDQEDSE